MSDISLAILFGIIVFVFSLFFIVMFNNKNKTISLKKAENLKWYDNLFTILFGDKDEKIIAKNLFVNEKDYIENCNLIRTEPLLKKIIGYRLIGFLILFFSLLMSLILSNYVYLLIGFFVSYILIILPPQKVENAAKTRKYMLIEDLPRFIDLLQTAVQINLPIETAIETTARNIDGVLSEELLYVIAQTKLNTANWQEALQEIARKYNIDIFSDFVLDIVTAHNKGISIYTTLVRKNDDIKHTKMLGAKETAAKMTNTILIPTFIFKIIPLLAIICIPIIKDIAMMR